MKKSKKPKKTKNPKPTNTIIKKNKNKMRLKKKKYDIIKCYWQDITTIGGWTPEAEVDNCKLCNVVTVGLYVSNCKDEIRIASSITLEREADLSDVTTIPKKVIKKIIVIGSVDKDLPTLGANKKNK